MDLTILGASGATGRELIRQALERGHTVTAISRSPVPGVLHVAADVRDSTAIAAALAGRATILSGLGNVRGADPGVLTAGARAVVAARPERIVWLGAFGSGPSAAAAGPVIRAVLRMLGDLPDKVAADALVLRAGGTVFHAGPLTNGPLSDTPRTAELDAAPRRLFPARVSRATVAAAMLDEAEKPAHAGTIALPLTA
ncbi:NAD(P)-dependent oxidoreductase [Symbioplanes lichenis]|uniref:NAD(P)-dependent oxidoreductase n=1 Tax=Symbioplanes lichenis TaxID=1629072 RepID=UPI00273998D6|nr:NAD(P)H-binding protein [Actinoplanes lichenis]